MRLAVALVIAVAACGPRSSRSGDDEAMPWRSSGIDWSRPPPPAATAAWTPPAIADVQLPNGVRILVVENHRLPLVAISALHAAAGSREDGAAAGRAALTSELLDEGTTHLSAFELSQLLDRRGIRIESVIATEYAAQHLVAPAERAGDALGLLADMLQRPAFAPQDVTRVRDTRVRELRARTTQPRMIAARVFDRVVFGTHPYGSPAEGTAESVSQLAANDVRAFWEHAYRPEAMTIVIAGDITRAAAERMIERAFGDWRRRPGVASPATAVPVFAPVLAVVDTPGAEQAVVIVGGRAGAIGDGDPLAADVANAILGGGTSARLERVLHDERGYTFGASSSFWRGQHAGSWTAAATFRRSIAGDALRELLAQIETARTTEPTAAELAEVRDNMVRGTQLAFETLASTNRAIERLVVQALRIDHYTTLPARLAALTPGAVRGAVADRWRDLAVVVVGDRAKLAAALESLGLPIVAYTADATRLP